MSQTPNPPRNPEETYRLYIDESGDHVIRATDDLAHRYLCLLGCWFRGGDVLDFHRRLDAFKQAHIPHSPDEPVILHREEIVNSRGAFWRLRDSARRDHFDSDLLELLSAARFTVVAVVIDKKALVASYPAPAHPYHLALGFLLQRYCGYLNHVNRRGDVMAESRGGREDRLLKDSYQHHYERGAWVTRPEAFQQALTSKELKLKPKKANIAGLQLADLLAHPVKTAILAERGLVPQLPPFAASLADAIRTKYNKQLYSGRIEGYGTVFFPK